MLNTDAQYRAALVSIGMLYEDYDGPLSDDMIESAKRIISERTTAKRSSNSLTEQPE